MKACLVRDVQTQVRIARVALVAAGLGWLTVGCGGSSFVSDSAASAAGGTGNTAGDTGAAGASAGNGTGGATAGVPGGGTPGTAGTGAGTSGGAGAPASCQADADCVPVVDLTDPCYSSCSTPRAGLRTELANQCVKEWQPNTSYPVPAACKTGAVPACPAVCSAVVCSTAHCNAGQCSLNNGYSAATCNPAPDCQTLQQALTVAIDKATQCTPGAVGTAACASPVELKDACGCTHPSDKARTAANKVAEDALAALLTAKCVIACPAIACPNNTGGAVCEANATGASHCAWAATPLPG